ncbi:MAG: PRC-barrel domain-containing protein, partial [Firmicutes bacterium]|nr:PRC-barrel domain-containing protein [Bacillota bacterium]
CRPPSIFCRLDSASFVTTMTSVPMVLTLSIGSVRSLVVDPAKMEVAALIIEQRGWFREQKIIPYAKVKSIGSDAVTINQSSNVQKPISLPEMLKLIKERANPIGTKVIAENGTVIGTVDEFHIDEATGKITGLEVSGKLLESLYKGKAILPIDSVSTIGTDVIVVTNDAESNLQKIDGGLQETIQNIREGTSSILESTIQRTKEISRNIKEKYEKKEKAPAVEPETEPEPGLDVTSEVEIKDANVLPEVVDANPTPEDQESEGQTNGDTEIQDSDDKNTEPEK